MDRFNGEGSLESRHPAEDWKRQQVREAGGTVSGTAAAVNLPHDSVGVEVAQLALGH